MGGHHNPWSSTAGAALYGESSLQAVHRETKEELGLLLKSDDYRFIERAYFDSYLMDVYETRWNGNSEDILFDPQEVSAVKWASIFEIQDMYITKRFYDRSTNYFSNMLGRE